MKHKFAVWGLVGLTSIGLTSFSVEVKKDDQQEPQNPRQLKLTKIEDGKMTELDTVISGKDVFIWNGEPIGLIEPGDSLRKRIEIQPRKRDGNVERMLYLNESGLNHFPPMPPMPEMKIRRGQHAGSIIDLNDPHILSYRKKDLHGGREKIEIIREKKEEADPMNFDFEFDQELNHSETPKELLELKGDQRKMKIMEKEIQLDVK